jgi:hypothetical protein
MLAGASQAHETWWGCGRLLERFRSFLLDLLLLLYPRTVADGLFDEGTPGTRNGCAFSSFDPG